MLMVPISDQKCHFSHPFSDLAFRQKLCYHYLDRLERKQKYPSNPFRIRIFLVLSYSFGIETINTFIHSHSFPRKPRPIPDQTGENSYPFADQKSAKTLLVGAADTYMAYIRATPRDTEFARKKTTLWALLHTD